MMITQEHYFGSKAHTEEQSILAEDLLDRVNQLMREAEEEGAFVITVCPNTGSPISGSKGGSGDGGFRLPGATTGAARSSHKEARGVDVYDPGNALDTWLDNAEGDGGSNPTLVRYGLSREHPKATPGWCHLTTRAVARDRQTFYP